MVVIIIPTLIWLGTIAFEKSPTLSFLTNSSEHQLSPPECKLANKTGIVTYSWCTLYPYQVLSWWHARFLWVWYWNCLFCIYTDPVAYIKVKGHQQWYICVELNGGYNLNHTEFDLAGYFSLRQKSNVKFLDTAGGPDGGPDRRTLIITHFVNVSQRLIKGLRRRNIWPRRLSTICSLHQSCS